MAYATPAAMVERFGEEEVRQLSDRAGVGAMDVSVVETAIEDADNEIDGYVGGRYDLPLPSAPPILKRLSCAIARYRLFRTLPPDDVRQDYEDAVDALKRIASGTIRLPVPETETEPVSATPARPASRVSVFTDTILGQM